jgi:hypothetical protein
VADTAVLRSLASDPWLAVLPQRAEPRVLNIAELRRAVGSLRPDSGVATREITSD